MKTNIKIALWMLIISVAIVVLFSKFFLWSFILFGVGLSVFSFILGLGSYLEKPSDNLMLPGWCPNCYDPNSLRAVGDIKGWQYLEKKCRKCGYSQRIDMKGEIVDEKRTVLEE